MRNTDGKHRDHRVRITWSDEQVRQGLPTARSLIDPAWADGSNPRSDESWSLVCSFEQPPNDQGNPTHATARFLSDESPAQLLVRGARLRLFERGTNQSAVVEVLD